MEYEEKGCPHPIVGLGVYCTRCYARVYCSRKCQDIDMIEGMHFLYCKPFGYTLPLSPTSPDVPYDVPTDYIQDDDDDEEYEQRSGTFSEAKRTLFLDDNEEESNSSSSSSSGGGLFKKAKSTEQEEDYDKDVYPSPDFLKELSLERRQRGEDIPESPFFYVSPNQSPYLPGTQPVLSDSDSE